MTHIVVDEQRKAYRTEGPRVAIVAGAGSGKTTVLTRRVEWMLNRGVDSASILICTFTIAAANELLERLDRRYLQVTTLHGWAHGELRRHHALVGLTADFSVYDAIDADAIAMGVAEDLGLKVRQRSAVMKHPAAAQLYQQRIREANGIDYDTLLDDLRKLLDHPEAGPAIRFRARHVLVDEAQDLDDLQHDLLEALAPETITMVADPRQTLYSWRGARPERFAAFCETATVVQLTQNRRSVGEIVELGNLVFEGTDYPPMAETRTEQGIGIEFEAVGSCESDNRWAAPIAAIRSLVARGYDPGEIAVLGRTWKALRLLRESLEGSEIRTAYLGPDLSPWETEAGRTIARWLALVLNPTDDNLAALVLRAALPDCDLPMLRAESRRRHVPILALAVELKLLPAPLHWQEPSHLHAAHLLKAVDTAWSHSRACGWCTEKLTSPQRRTLRSFRWWWTLGRSAVDSHEFVPPHTVTLTTVHGAKGLAWRGVVLLDASDYVYKGTPDQPTDDRHTLYVAITRARDALILTRPETHYVPPGHEMPTAWPAYLRTA